ncbi:AAA family ATPase [Cupriavidus basilensis]|uniref:AAA family ATPase n=1 Tax=Cupriavidus basilensis TaxID=68895 RepID=UPI00075130DE|nr:pilus assembly protein [Cupriavidus basilensis]
MGYFLFNAAQPEPRQWLSAALSSLGQLAVEPGPQDVFLEQIATINPGMVFLHFSREQALASGRLAEQVTRLYPGLPLVAVGNAGEPEIMLAALRGGAKDFIDMTAPPGGAVEIVRRLLTVRGQAEPARRGKVVAVLGARVGVGATTLATNLAAAVRKRCHGEVLLMDLGLPARDGSLYMNINPGFHFVEGVRNLRRFDQVFVQTALARHGNGVVVLPLPATLAELRDISFMEALGLLNRLRAFFDLQVVDLGGFSNIEFMAHLVKAADTVLLMVDQGVGAIVSAAELLQELKKREVEREDLHLLVSRFDARLGVDAQQIAQRLEATSVGTLPDRREPLVLALNRGVVLADDSPADPYVRAVGQLVDKLGYRAGTASEAGLLGRVKEKLPEALRAMRALRTERAGN